MVIAPQFEDAEGFSEGLAAVEVKGKWAFIGAETDEYGIFAWMNEYPAHETDLGPRNFVEQRGMQTWGEVTAYLASRPRKPWWYTLPSARVVARRKFDELILSELLNPGRAQEL